MKKTKFVLLSSSHEENEVQWDAKLEEWVPVLNKHGKPTFRRYNVPGQIVESHRDLCALFRGKFDLYEKPPPVPKHHEGGMPPAMSSDGMPAHPKGGARPEKEKPVAAPKPKGKDVTGSFPKSRELGVSVRKYGDDRYVIIEADGSEMDGGELTRTELKRTLNNLVTA